jgi:hypothetical protein
MNGILAGQERIRLLGAVRGCCGFDLPRKLDVVFGYIAADVAGADGDVNGLIAECRV